jgi:toxin-antitoxin system PIN domain toxin
MRLLDVNVLVYAHRKDAADHARYRSFVERLLSSESAHAVSDLVLSGFVRVVTHPRVFKVPSPLETALSFAGMIRNGANSLAVAPGPRHWEIFQRLCQESGARGNLVPDAYLAALAIEVGAELTTTDRDFSRFRGLRYGHPFDG